MAAFVDRLYFPPVDEDETRRTEAELEAEAKAVASELPSAPTFDPSDEGHVSKKQKQGDV